MQPGLLRRRAIGWISPARTLRSASSSSMSARPRWMSFSILSLYKATCQPDKTDKRYLDFKRRQ